MNEILQKLPFDLRIDFHNPNTIVEGREENRTSSRWDSCSNFWTGRWEQSVTVRCSDLPLSLVWTLKIKEQKFVKIRIGNWNLVGECEIQGFFHLNLNSSASDLWFFVAKRCALSSNAFPPFFLSKCRSAAMILWYL